MEENNLNVDFMLLPHQERAVSGADNIYASGKRVAGVKLPTGGGKSFVAMMEILKANGNDYRNKSNDGVVNDASIMYVAPTNEILYQIQTNIAEFILKKDVDKMTKEEIIAAVRVAFPNIELKCYATLISEMKSGTLVDKDPDLVILDEAHRSGARESQQAVAQLLGCNIKNGQPTYNPDNKKKGRVLAISATPERDVDGKNMMDLWATALDDLTLEQIESREHVGYELDLDTAVREGIVVKPEVIHFDANLVDTPDYKRLIELYAASTGKTKDSLREKIDEINRNVIGIPNYDTLTPEEQTIARELRNIEVMAQAIRAGKIPEGGKMIMFIPHNVTDKFGNKPEKADFFASKIEFIKKMLGDQFELRTGVLSSDYKDEENTATLDIFNKPTGTLTPEEVARGRSIPSYSIIIASDKLNEGIHAKGITNSFMERRVQEGENTNQRAQTILFLQQIGRTVFSIIPGKEPKSPVIFDYACNFYTQNRDNPRKDKIDIFELTETQRELFQTVNMAIIETYKANAPIPIRLARLMETMKILQEYNFGPKGTEKFTPTTPMFNQNTTLEELLSQEPLAERKEEILKRLIEDGLYSPKKPYKIGKDYIDAKTAFWKGAKCFEGYNFEELIAAGIVDTKSREGMSELASYSQKGFVDVRTGFIVMGAAESFRTLNIYTGTELDPNGENVRGIDPSRYDGEGYDEDGYDMRGFNRDGIHKATKTIHDASGFMKNGKNIQTGTRFDILGYDADGIKPEYGYIENESGEKERVIIGGWDKKGLWHLPNADGGYGVAISEWSEGREPKVDVHGFNTRNRWAETGSTMNDYGFFANGEHYDGFWSENGHDKFKNKQGYDIDGFDGNGFDVRGSFRDTGTRYDNEGRKISYYSKTAIEVRKTLKMLKEKNPEVLQKALGIYPDGKFHTKNGKVQNVNAKGFTTEGINLLTESVEDIYGFTMLDYVYRGKQPIVNEFGFKPSEVPTSVIGKDKYEFYKQYRFKGKTHYVNILGTDKTGKTVDGKKHESLICAEEFIEKCMKQGMSIEKFIEEYAISHQMLVPEAKKSVQAAFTRASTLYRICPELQIDNEYEKAFLKGEPDKIKAFIAMCPLLKGKIKADVKVYTEEIERLEQEKLDKTKSPEETRKKIERLKAQNEEMVTRIKSVPGLDLGDK